MKRAAVNELSGPARRLLLIRSPRVCGGRLRTDGIRITVAQISLWYRQDCNPEEITELYPHLIAAEVYTSLAYYHVNREEIETDLASEQKEPQFRDITQPLILGLHLFVTHFSNT
jgi:uncharacterized protein (DUF433 family)